LHTDVRQDIVPVKTFGFALGTISVRGPLQFKDSTNMIACADTDGDAAHNLGLIKDISAGTG
jgi:hypothetical protein